MPLLYILAAGAAIGTAIGLPIFANKAGEAYGAEAGKGTGDAIRYAGLATVAVVGYTAIKYMK